MKKIFIALFLALSLAGAGFYAHIAEGSHGGNVTGWLWGGSTDDNLCPTNPNLTGCGGIGWINASHDTPQEPSLPSSNYGLNIPPSATTPPNVTGYAWSSNVGWIDFQPGGDPPASPPNVGVRRDGNTLVGWARIVSIQEADLLNNSGGWEGWIKLSGTNYGVRIIPETSLLERLEGYAWSNELGWIDFSRVSIPPDDPGDPASCRLSANPTNGPSPLSGSLTWTTQNNPISCIASGGWSGNQNPVGDSASYGPISDTTTYSLTCSNAMGQSGSCETTVVVTGLTVSCAGAPNPAPLTGGSVTVNWTGRILSPGTTPYTYSWTFDGNARPSSALIPSPSTVYTTAGQKNATLTVTDHRGVTSSAPCAVTVGKKGIWREILPFLR